MGNCRAGFEYDFPFRPRHPRFCERSQNNTKKRPKSEEKNSTAFDRCIPPFFTAGSRSPLYISIDLEIRIFIFIFIFISTTTTSSFSNLFFLPRTQPRRISHSLQHDSTIFRPLAFANTRTTPPAQPHRKQVHQKCASI